MNMDVLREMREWAALGFYEAEAEGLPWPMNYGRALRRLYENMEIVVPEGRWLIPVEPMEFCQTRASDNTWHAESMVFNLHHDSGLMVNQRLAARKKGQFPERAAFIDAMVADLKSKTVRFGGYTHANPDIRRVVGEGVLAMEAELDGELAAVRAMGESADSAERNLLLALKDYVEGVKAFHRRTLEAIGKARDAASGRRRDELAVVAEAVANCFLVKSETFYQGLLAVNFAWMLDGCDSIGRLDQALGPLFERDIREGRLDVAFARELLDEFWCNFETMNGWNLQIGGYTPAGKDGCNELTRECIRACARNKLRRPNVALRITRDTPDDLLAEALEALAKGSGRPALYNDDLYVEALRSMDLGLSDVDAREIGFGGCTETMIAGLSNVGSLEGSLNLAKALELAMFDGFDPVANVQAGPHTGRFADFASFEAFMAALKLQIAYATDAFVAVNRGALKRRFSEGDPKLYRTFFTGDCVKNRKSFEAGGARYNWAVVSYQGIANTIDGTAAIRKTVFEDKSVAAAELVAALRSNFHSCDDLRRRLRACPKFGNDIAFVDDLGAELIEYAWRHLYRHETPRGGRYLASCILFTTYLGAGRAVGATPDGRGAGEALVDSVGAVPGNDVNGPTALLKSVAKLPLWLAAGTPVLNLRFQKSLFANRDVLAKMASLVRSFFSQGGMQAQISVLDAAELRAAQTNPEPYRDLIVRIGGYSEYFNALDKELQDSVISRTEYGL